jgi:hypothetical protein
MKEALMFNDWITFFCCVGRTVRNYILGDVCNIPSKT